MDATWQNALTAKEAIGYKELVSFLDGAQTFEEAVEQIKIATRRYAKRQRSWFRRDKHIIWIDAESRSLDEMTEEIVEIYRSTFKRY